jgi:hypothetical protein
MTIPMRFGKRQIAIWGMLLAVGVLPGNFSGGQAQEKVYPPEPEPLGIRLTPLSNLQKLEGDLMMAVATGKPATTKANVSKPASRPAKTTAAKPAPRLAPLSKTDEASTKAPANAEKQEVSAPLPALLENAESANHPAQPETLPLKPQTEMPPVKGSTLGKVTSFLQKHAKPTSYTPLEAIAVFPVLKHGQEKAFGDLPIIFSREMALRLESAAPKTRVYNPVYTVDELRLRGLGHIYDQIMGYYLKAGRPEPKATDYMLKQLALTDGKTISRVIFIEADLDINHATEQSGLFDRLNGWLTDSTLKQMKYFINSRVQVFDAENPNFPMVWGGSWRRSLKTNQFGNVTPSVFADSDSQQAFSALSREMSREILWLAPKEAYMSPQFDLSVQGKLVSQKENMLPVPIETSAEKTRMSEANRQAIQRVLQRQGSP